MVNEQVCLESLTHDTEAGTTAGQVRSVLDVSQAYLVVDVSL